MKRSRRGLIFLATVLFSALFAIIFKWRTTGEPFHPSTVLFGVIILFTVLISLAINYKFFRRYLIMPVNELKKRIIPAFIIFMLLMLFISLVIIGLFAYLFNLMMGFETDNFVSALFEVEFPSAIKYYSISTIIVSSFFFYNIWRQAIDREQKLQEENMKYKYISLKRQLDPHFLFNSLNALSEIVYNDPKRADDYILKLSGIYRYILDKENTDLVSLDREIEFVEQYFDLQRERDGNKICLEIDIEDAEKFEIVPISLQTLVENALKHNAISEDNPLNINIFIENGYVVVSNAIRKKGILNSSSGIGLSNLKERVMLITEREVIINQANGRFMVKVPVINI